MERKSQVPCRDGKPLDVAEVGRWAKIAVTHAIVLSVDDPAGLIATVAGVDGAWGFGASEAEALEDLESALIGWASLKLEDGDDDIPSLSTSDAPSYTRMGRAWR